MQETYLSVIIKARNEEKNIAKCISSVWNATSYLIREDKKVEVLVIDSNSTDNTVSIAKKLGAKVYQIPKDEDCSPAAGVYVGIKHAKGKYVHLLDGDAILHPDWFKNSLVEFDKDEKLALVCGTRVESVEGEHDIYVCDRQRRKAGFKVKN